MIITTTETIPGKEITEILGIFMLVKFLLVIAKRIDDKDKEDFEKRKY
ncbi:MAG: hypothetical protein K9J25_12685 [Bacteroidales bacterium]|nr:hypothetical protein [Bacteroidales bacterium]